MIEKNGALNGVRTIVTLIPERRIGIAVFANKQLTVFPEAVRAESRARAWAIGRQPASADPRRAARLALPGRLAEAAAGCNGARARADAFAGQYQSDFYGPVEAAPRTRRSRSTSASIATLRA